MKKIFIILVILILFGAIGYFIYTNYYLDKTPKIVPEETIAEVEEYYFYGNTFNIKASLNLVDTNFKKIKLTLFDKEFIYKDINYELEGNILNLSFSDLINDGLIIDDLNNGKYSLFIALYYDNPENQEEDIIKYYKLNNNTKYSETTYYTISNYNKKILVNTNNEYSTLMFNISDNKDKEIYDIVIDPGHGGMDGGASSNGYNETDFTYLISTKLKESLENVGLKVKLTRDDTLTKNDILDEYGKHGRAVVSSEVYAKYLFSIHLNSNSVSSVSGLEIYTPNNINYDFAKSLVENITTIAGIKYSPNKTSKVMDGIYTRTMTEEDINSSKEKLEKKEKIPYDITTNANYYYMIRETGGYLTGAYVDNRNDQDSYNMYYDSNRGCESYILELGYITNISDIENLNNNMDKYIEAITLSIKNKLNIKETE